MERERMAREREAPPDSGGGGGGGGTAALPSAGPAEPLLRPRVVHPPPRSTHAPLGVGSALRASGRGDDDTPRRCRRGKLVVSDLHMGTGHRHGEHNPWESFSHDDRFCEFLHHHASEEHKDDEVELIINGDFFDFIQVPSGGRFPIEITEAIAVEKLHACMDGHDEVIGALATFLSMPRKSLTLIPGNHDPEWVFPAVQRAFVERLTGTPTHPRVRFVVDRPEYEFDGIQVQHGQQLELHNFHNFEEPFVRGRGKVQILHLPWGTQFLLAVMTRLKEARPHIDRVRPFKAFMMRAVIFDPWFFVRAVVLSVFHFLRTRVFNLRNFGARMRQNWKLLTEAEVYPNLFVKVRHILEHRPDLDCVILGHTHIPLVRRMKDGRQYVNGGCWTDTVSLDLGSFGQRSQPTYVRIEYPDAPGARPFVSLRQWNGRRLLFEELRY